MSAEKELLDLVKSFESKYPQEALIFDLKSICKPLVNVQCKNCKTTFKSKSLLIHLGKKKDCKVSYSEQELADLHSDAKQNSAKQRKVWRSENKDYLSEKNAEYRDENKETIRNRKAKYYSENKESILENKKQNYDSKQRVEKYKQKKADRALLEKMSNWWHYSPREYFTKKENALRAWDMWQWNENSNWQKEIERLKLSDLSSPSAVNQLNNLKEEIVTKMRTLEMITKAEVQDIENELGLPETREYENEHNDSYFQIYVFKLFERYINFKQRHVRFLAYDKLKDIAENIGETFELKGDYWEKEMNQREKVKTMLKMEEKDQVNLNEEYFQEIKNKMFSIHRKFHNKGKSMSEIKQEYEMLQNPPTIYISPYWLTYKAIEECETRGYIYP